MTRAAGSPWFLVWVAFCSALSVAIATGTAIDDSSAALVAANLIGLSIGVVVAFGSFYLVTSLSSEPPEWVAPPVVEQEPVAAPTEWASPEPHIDDLRNRLEARLAEGRELSDERSQEWIDATRTLLEPEAPGAARYFAAATWPGHVARLETILRDFL